MVRWPSPSSLMAVESVTREWWTSAAAAWPRHWSITSASRNSCPPGSGSPRNPRGRPGCSFSACPVMVTRRESDQDAWERAGHLAATVTGAELRELGPGEVIRRLFHEEDVRLFDPIPFRFRCRCSRDRVAAMLYSLGESEMRETLAEEGQVEVFCDFCNEPYRFDAVDIEALFTDPVSRPPDSQQQH